ncbi:trace amine-associated receptor 13c-like [Polymixia lowei]
MMETLEGAELCFPHLLNTSCRKPKGPPTEDAFFYISVSFISLCTVALNLLVIISISHYRQLHTPTNLLLLSLAFSDLAVGLMVLPIEILFIAACWTLGDVMCVLCYLVPLSATSSSVGNMVLISIDRYMAICYPLHYRTRITLRRVQICVCTCWVSSVCYNSLLLKDHLRQPERYKSCYGECLIVINDSAGVVDIVLTFIAPITVIVVLYMRVFVVAVSQARAMRSHIVSVTLVKGSMSVGKSERKAARTLGIVIAVFLLCFCPYYCLVLTGHSPSKDASGGGFGVFILYLNSCLNPVIYAFFYPWFRKAIKLIVTLQILQPDSCEVNML